MTVDTFHVEHIAEQLHARACYEGCPLPPTSGAWLRWAQRIAGGHTTLDQAARLINPEREKARQHQLPAAG